jgi:hypothetical protein
VAEHNIYREAMYVVRQDIIQSTSKIIPLTGFELAVPKSTAKLLYISDKDPPAESSICGISISLNLLDGQVKMAYLQSDEPSTIYTRMSVGKPRNIDEIPHPKYFPTYVGLTPEQKWIYLNWLRNIAEPINIGYVFLYYYGLERHLLIGEFDLAFDEILYLRKHHNNSSFMFYSSSALLHSSIFHKRLDRLEEFYRSTESHDLRNIDLLIMAYHFGSDLSAKNLMSVAKSMSGIDRRYIKKDELLFEYALNECLKTRYGYPNFPLADCYKIQNLPKRQDVIFANISFPPEVRTPEIPSFFGYDPFLEEIRALFAEAHKRTKLLLKEKQRGTMALSQPPKAIDKQ